MLPDRFSHPMLQLSDRFVFGNRHDLFRCNYGRAMTHVACSSCPGPKRIPNYCQDWWWSVLKTWTGPARFFVQIENQYSACRQLRKEERKREKRTLRFCATVAETPTSQQVTGPVYKRGLKVPKFSGSIKASPSHLSSSQNFVLPIDLECLFLISAPFSSAQLVSASCSSLPIRLLLVVA